MVTKLHFRKYGTGPEKVVMFHGFGQNQDAFKELLPELGDEFTVYLIDLYYHGKSHRPDRALSKKGWKDDFQAFLIEQRIDRCSLIGFSLGGRFAISSAIELPQHTDQLILIAPDGVWQNFWYRLATSRLGNPLFKHLMFHPQKFDRWVSLFEKHRLTNSSMIRFARKELSDRKNCLRVYRSWTYFKPLQYHIPQLIAQLNQTGIPVHVILGDKDSIIPVHEVTSKVKGIHNLNIHILPHKHHHLILGSKDLIPSLLQGKKL